MPKVATIQNSFSGGEISPLSQGRVDDPRYKSSLATCENYVPLLQGPKTRRPGTTFVGRARYANKKSRVIPFVFSTSQTYMLEFSGSGFIRFFKNGAPILRGYPAGSGQTLTISAITNANPVQITGNIT